MTMYAVLIVACLLLRLSAATNVENCGGDENAVVSISNCEDSPCILKKNTSVKLSMEFTPDEDVPELRNSVHANIGVDMPFLGVDRTDACPQVYMTDGSKAGCPLKKGQKYMYKNEFHIHKVYPKVELLVNWKLKTLENKVIVCFTVPSKIVD